LGKQPLKKVMKLNRRLHLIPKIEKPKHFETKFSSRQPELFEVGWLRGPIEEIRAERKSSKRVYSEQLKLPFSKAA